MIDTSRDIIGSSHHVYLIGIGGVGMSALARVLKYQGLQVSGSDARENNTTKQLLTEGIRVYIGQNETRFQDVDTVIYSTAIGTQHLELKTARQMGLKVYHRAEVLSSLLNQAETSIAVTGTHGKTTTSSMVAYVMSQAGRRPTCLVGGDVLNFGTNTILGDKNLWVSEVDESDKSHELYAPNYVILTNLEMDHVDHYAAMQDLESSFLRFLSNLRDPGVVIYSEDDEILDRVVHESGRPHISFGLSTTADYSAQEIKINAFGTEFDFYEAGFFSATVRLSVPGIHNVRNALGVMALLIQMGMDPSEIGNYLSSFRGAKRRLEVKFKTDDVVVVDDYAHHPTEVKASLKALKGVGKKVIAIFQPHRFSRTSHFIKEFSQAFEDADELILTDVYSAGEANLENINVNMICEQVKKNGHPPVITLAKEAITRYLLEHLTPGSIIAFLGAGDIGDIADEFACRFKNNIASKS
ncbi:MAG: UDP-N-acetylmuramate--L-alanine ligase [Candidatus Omnitrophica bacterium]|nr:UDP-N-acetylmuramate--L-alanine ligase [Candidatus Omnitrophota bacterium]MDD5670437.1 UDP-N-acetylmuramate--L-alanine ligase [Candidatus Omnitrophota bacterium]